MARRDWDEVCYPFIRESSCLCDFEILTDELCSEIGNILSDLPAGHDDILTDLQRLQPLIWHYNGSIRGRMAVKRSDIEWLRSRLECYRAITGPVKEFVLPGGPAPVASINRARSITKKTIRALVRVEREDKEVPEILFQFGNLLCNYLFALICVINSRSGFQEIPFRSKSYGKTSITKPGK